MHFLSENKETRYKYRYKTITDLCLRNKAKLMNLFKLLVDTLNVLHKFENFWHNYINQKYTLF